MQSHTKRSILIIIIVACLITGTLGLIVAYHQHQAFHFPLQTLVFTALSAIANMLLALIAFWQLPLIEKTGREAEITTRGQFLISLNEQWMQKDVFEARCYLHHLALQYKGPKMSNHINKSIQLLSEEKSLDSIKKFAQIISLLEFMETLGTLYRHGHINIVVIEELFGGSLERYYYYLSKYIEHRRTLGSPSGVHFYSDRFLYQGFDFLIQDLRNLREENS